MTRLAHHLLAAGIALFATMFAAAVVVASQGTQPGLEVATLVPAQTAGFTESFSTGGRFEAPEGTSHVLLALDLAGTDPPLAGLTCDVSVATTNQVSVHPGNELLVETNGTDLVLVDIEAVEGQPSSGSAADVEMGDTLTVTLRLGTGDFGRLQTSSIEGTVSASCQTEPPPTTSTTPSTSVPSTVSSTAAPPTSVPTSTTASSPTSTSSVPQSSAPETTVERPPTTTPSTSPPSQGSTSSTTFSTPPSTTVVVRVPTTEPPDECPPGYHDIDPSTAECDRAANVESG